MTNGGAPISTLHAFSGSHLWTLTLDGGTQWSLSVAQQGFEVSCTACISRHEDQIELMGRVNRQNQFMPNELNVGEPRYGSLSNDNPETPNVSATLERTSKGVFLSLTFEYDESPEYAQWFTRDFFAGTASLTDGTRARPSVPSALLFYDSYGSVALIGCQSGGYHTNHRIGSGRIQVGAAVLAAPSIAHAKVMGMRAEVSGLRSWLGTSGISETITHEEKTGRFLSSKIEVVIPQTINIPDSNLVMRPAIRRRWVEGSLIIENIVWVEHKTAEESSWRVHEMAMRAVRDLLAVSRWRAESLIPVSVARTEDSLDGNTPEEDRRQWWRAVVDSRAPEPKEDSQRLEHLISWEDIGPDGLARWIKLRDDFARAIDPAVSSVYLDDVTIEVHLTQIAISLEALGYLLAMRKDGVSENKAGGLSFQQRLDRIVQDVEGLLPFVDETWSKRMADTYNSVKHANRALPEAVDVANSWREGALLFRTWIANELGVDYEELRTRIARTPQIHSYVAADE